MFYDIVIDQHEPCFTIISYSIQYGCLCYEGSNRYRYNYLSVLVVVYIIRGNKYLHLTILVLDHSS